ncbi:MAG: hypothetical protein N3D75_02210 [Candidatus Aenigmarchaeota archaeon]|nr:hypothetical protein [Candidatus Aenigmarchaeota archaeon]
MGIFNLKKPVKEPLPEPLPMPEPVKSEPVQESKDDYAKLKFDLMLSEIENVKAQMQMINERLKMIEKKIDQRTTIRYV